MKKPLFIILLLVFSLFLVSCANESPDRDDDMDIEDDLGEVDDVDDEPLGTDEDSRDDDADTDTDVGDDKFAYSLENITDFDLDIELRNGQEIEYDLDDNKDEVLDLLENIQVDMEKTLREIMETTMAYFDLTLDDVEEFELQLELNNQQELDFKFNRREGSENMGVDEFDLDIDFWDDSEWDFDYELDDGYKVEGVENLSGDEAETRIEELIKALDPSIDKSIGQMKDNLFKHLDISEEDVEEFDLDLEYLDGMEIDIKVHY